MSTLRQLLTVAALAAAPLLMAVDSAEAHPNQWPLQRAMQSSWSNGYAHVQYGQPVALVVPPTAQLQTNWGWGVGSSRISRIDHQFVRDYPGPGPFGGGYRQQPVWPQDTNQFGVYYVRAPW